MSKILDDVLNANEAYARNVWLLGTKEWFVVHHTDCGAN